MGDKMMKPIAIDDFCQLKNISGVEFSPDGESACFVVTQAQKKKLNTLPAFMCAEMEKSAS